MTEAHADTTRRFGWWLTALTVVALLLAVGAAISWQQERSRASSASRAQERAIQARDELRPKIAAAESELTQVRNQVRAALPPIESATPVLAALDRNHRDLSVDVDTRLTLGEEIITDLANGNGVAYNDQAARLRAAIDTTDAHVSLEDGLRTQLTGGGCGTNCSSGGTSGTLPSQLRGAGDTRSSPIALPANWDLGYAYQCPATTISGYFDIVIRDTQDGLLESGVSVSKLGASGVVHKHGSPYPVSAILDIHSNCPWTITLTPS